MLIWLTRSYAKFGGAFTLSSGRRAMNRFARSAALAGAALVALVLAIAASATNAKSDRSAAPSAGAAVTNYLTYVKGKRGKADPKKSQGLHRLGQPAGRPGRDRRAGDRRRRARREVRQRRARRRRRPSGRARRVLHQVERGGRHDLRAEARQQQANLLSSRRARSPRERSRSSQRSAARKPVVTGVAVTPVDGASKNAVVLFGDASAHPPAVRQLREERPQGEDRRGHLPERAGPHGGRAGDRGRPEGRPAST